MKSWLPPFPLFAFLFFLSFYKKGKSDAKPNNGLKILLTWKRKGLGRWGCCCRPQAGCPGLVILSHWPAQTWPSWHFVPLCEKEKSSQTGRVFPPPIHWGFVQYEAGKTCESIKTRPIRENATIVVCLLVMLPPLFPAVKKVLTLSLPPPLPKRSNSRPKKEN